MNTKITIKPTDHRGCSLWDVLAVIAVLILGFFALLPFLARSKSGRSSARIKCVLNLKQVGLAFRVWEGDNNDHYPMRVLTNSLGGPLYTNSVDAFRYFQFMSNELSNPQIVYCPEDKKRRAPTNFTTDFNGSHISYFIGLDADETVPKGLLAGDSNLTNGQPLKNGVMQLTTNSLVNWTMERHRGAGNIGLADGSVMQFTSAGLQTFLKNSGLTNRLLMPP